MALNKEQQPVAWQRKLRKRGTPGWGEWKECTKAQADYAEAYGHPQDFEEVEAIVRPLYASPHPEGVITEEMVDRSLERWFLGEEEVIADCHEEMHEEWRKDMRATLEAALYGDYQTITDEMVNRAYDAFVAACEWSDWDETEVRGYLRTALTAALKDPANDQ